MKDVRMTARSDSTCSVTISVLNWNTADQTLDCVRSLLELHCPENCTVQILVIDNGSREDDFAKLNSGLNLNNVIVHREKQNQGFAGGHNISIARAVAEKTDFIWLVNSDALVESNTLALLLDEMAAHPTCGAVSPMIVATNDDQKMDFCANVHDWKNRSSIRATTLAEGMRLQQESPANVWVAGTAVLFRVATLAQVGPLDASLFAYYEDDDIAARLSKAGWVSRTAFNAKIRHAVFEKHFDRPPHFHYLTNRNHLAFWYKYTPAPHRRLLWLRLLDQRFYDINRLYLRGLTTQADAGLLGIHDFITGRFGVPDLTRQIPFGTKLLQRFFSVTQRKALRNTPRSN